jgi:hypothetical protein
LAREDVLNALRAASLALIRAEAQRAVLEAMGE